jgi:hypothetical protein
VLGIALCNLEEELPRPFVEHLARGFQPILLRLGVHRHVELSVQHDREIGSQVLGGAAGDVLDLSRVQDAARLR